LIRGRAKEALAELRKSVTAQGGLDTNVSLAEVVTRSDLALAALQAGDKDAAREYLAYTGAGRVADAPFASARSFDLPACGGAAAIAPEDSAVVEFSIGDDGATSQVRPVWASRGGPMALAFAKSVKGWSWAPADLARIKPFFRLITRVELRCSTRAARPMLPVFAAGNRWAQTSGAPVTGIGGSDAQTLPLLRAELARRTAAGAGDAELVPVLFALGSNSLVDAPESATLISRIATIARASGAPLVAQAHFDMIGAQLYDKKRITGARATAGVEAKLRALLALPAYAANPEIAGTLRLTLAATVGKSAPNEALTLTSAVADDRNLMLQDPLRIAALVQLADLKTQAGDLEAARASYARTGLDDTQCALIGSAPSLTGGTDGTFPREAQAWGFEGWVRLETDVTGAGRTINQRAIVAYPPFVFRDAAVDMAKQFRFAKTYRPAGDAGCTGFQTTVRFQIL
jgi:hypothetical protein